MKSHISATIDSDLLSRVDRYRQRVRRSRSQIIEIAVESLLAGLQAEGEEIVTSEGRFEGSFSRQDTYER